MANLRLARRSCIPRWKALNDQLYTGTTPSHLISGIRKTAAFLEKVLAHEIGHDLGLRGNMDEAIKHSFWTNDIMIHMGCASMGKHVRRSDWNVVNELGKKEGE